MPAGPNEAALPAPHPITPEAIAMAQGRSCNRHKD